MAKARRRGGSQFSDPSGTLPPAGVIDDGLVDLAGPRRALPELDREPVRGVSDRLPARQVLTVHKRRRVRDGKALAKLVLHMPSAVRFCISRKVRREVLFALRKSGFSGSARKKHWRRGVNSQWRC